MLGAGTLPQVRGQGEGQQWLLGGVFIVVLQSWGAPQSLGLYLGVPLRVIVSCFLYDDTSMGEM